MGGNFETEQFRSVSHNIDKLNFYYKIGSMKANNHQKRWSSKNGKEENCET